MTAVAGLGFPKTRRLRARSEYLAAQAASARVTTPHFVLLLAPSTAGAPARLGVTASKHVGDAVRRNRTKRLVREAFRLHGELFPDGVDVVVIARAGAPDLGLADVVAEWTSVRGLIAKRSKRRG